MDQRKHTDEHNRSRSGRVNVPTRRGIKSGSVPIQSPKPIIPLLDEKKPSSKLDLIPKLLSFPKKHPKKSVIALSLILIFAYAVTRTPNKDPAVVKDTQTQGGITQLPRNETPKFETVLPTGKTIADYGGWTRVSPPNSEAVFAYADKLGGIPITVSQQPLPKGFDDDPEKNLEALSKDFHAEQKLTVEGKTVYIGTSAKGPQSVILTKDGLLILIKSTSKISNDLWSTYISSLE